MMNAEQLRRQIQSLTDKLSTLEATGKRGRKRRRGNVKAAVVPGTTAQGVSVPMAGTGRRRRRNRRNPGPGSAIGSGEMRFGRRELLRSFKLPANKTEANDWVDIHPDNFSLLKNVAKSFERMRWNSVKIFWKPAVGTTFGGLVTVGIDWDLSSAKTDRQGISAYTPSQSFSVWQDTQSNPLVLPPNRLQSRQWYTREGNVQQDRIPAKICWAVDASSQAAEVMLGEFWVEYELILSGTTS